MKYKDFVDYLESVGYSDRYKRKMITIYNYLMREHGRILSWEEARATYWRDTYDKRRDILKFINLYERFKEVSGE